MPKATKEPRTGGRVARSRKPRAIKLPAVGAKTPHALVMTRFADDVRAVMKSDWPASADPDVQVNTYAFDPVGQCIDTSPLPKYLSELTVTSEGLCKQCQEPEAGTQEWVFVRL